MLKPFLIALALGGPIAAASAPHAVAAASSATAREAMARGVSQAQAGDYAAARASLDEALRLDPSLKDARVMRGMVLGALGQTDAALADLDASADQLAPIELLEMKGQILFGSNRYREAIETYEALTRLEPKNAEAFKRLGHARQASEMKGQGALALVDYARALELDPNYLLVYALRGEILAAQGDVAGIDSNYQAWLARAPNDADAHAAYAQALAGVGKAEQARAEIDKALAIKPTAQAYMTRARLTPNDKHEAILADIDKALALSPNQTSFAYLLRAQKRAQWGEFDLALTDADKALDGWSENIGARILRYRLNQFTGRYDATLADLDLLIARDPGTGQYFNDRCWTRVLAGKDLDKALVDCDHALKLEPQSPAVLDSRGWVKLRQGDARAAIVDFDAALAQQPKQSSSLFGRGVARRRAGEVAKGDADLAAARALDPEVQARFATYGVKP